jgi:hypothetical protein
MIMFKPFLSYSTLESKHESACLADNVPTVLWSTYGVTFDSNLGHMRYSICYIYAGFWCSMGDSLWVSCFFSQKSLSFELKKYCCNTTLYVVSAQQPPLTNNPFSFSIIINILFQIILFLIYGCVMVESEFIGRRSELELLEDLWQSPRATFLILYGRRRIGKTRLLTHWLRQYSDRGLYWVAEPTSSLEQLRSFSQAIYNYATPDSPAPQDYTYASWEQAFREVAKLASDQRFILFIDEVTYLMAVNPKFIGILQKSWDQWLSKANLMLVLSGSHMGMMQKQILAYDAPLYGRATAHVQLPPMPFWTTKVFFPDYSARERVSIYSVWGGIPAYWERLSLDLSFEENLRRQLQPSNMWMMDEPAFLLKDFVNDPYNYVSILRSLSDGAHTAGSIVKRTGLSKGHITSYLSTLRDTGFVAREVPVTEDEATSRRGRYYVTDPYLRFYYYALASYQSKLALGAQDELLEDIRKKLPAFIESYTWHDLCAEWILRASIDGELPVSVESVGAFWLRSQDIDLCGIDRIAGSLVLAVRLWDDVPKQLDVMADLIEKTRLIVPSDDEREWQVYYIGFSAAGWEENVLSSSEQLATSKANSSGKWKSMGVRLLDLETVDENLQQWSR